MKLFLSTLIMLSAVNARCESLFDFGNFFSSVRAGYVINQHGQKSEIFYTAIQVFHNKEKIEYASLNIGYEGLLKRPVVSVGLRADNLFPLVWGTGGWAKDHITTAKLPTFECGPYVSVWPKGDGNLWHMDLWYGLSAAIGF